ncbi:Anamorsin-like protein [Frankliniella fusca]|uniref:Anamorsin-like protein n=1 Tax=Frankliniella fusca TaxID=407009 RepID=A0AAE1H8N1_9NEOP|nr:Anamorsin-like protein [Frankliniella fusca]
MISNHQLKHTKYASAKKAKSNRHTQISQRTNKRLVTQICSDSSNEEPIRVKQNKKIKRRSTKTKATSSSESSEMSTEDLKKKKKTKKIRTCKNCKCKLAEYSSSSSDFEI